MPMLGTGARVRAEPRRRKDGARSRKCATAPYNCRCEFAKHAGHTCFDEACFAARACLAFAAAVAAVELRGRALEPCHGDRAAQDRMACAT